MFNFRNIISILLLITLVLLVVVSIKDSKSSDSNAQNMLSTAPNQEQENNGEISSKTPLANKDEAIPVSIIKHHWVKKHTLLWACVGICLTILVGIFLTKRFFDNID